MEKKKVVIALGGNALGKDIVLGAIIKAKDINQIEECIIRELNRRGLTPISETIEKDTVISTTDRDAIHDNCVAAGYTNDESGVSVVSAAQLKRYVDFIKELYSKIVVS